MELQVKHYAPYLPFVLKVRCFRKSQSLFIKDLILTGDVLDYILIDNYHNDYKPILKPLSDFDAIEQIKLFVGMGHWCDMYDEFFKVWFNDPANIDKLILQCSYEIMQYFFKNHYDVFGLINEGLAVSIHDVEPSAFIY